MSCVHVLHTCHAYNLDMCYEVCLSLNALTGSKGLVDHEEEPRMLQDEGYEAEAHPRPEIAERVHIYHGLVPEEMTSSRSIRQVAPRRVL